jgi:hypothetical protein
MFSCAPFVKSSRSTPCFGRFLLLSEGMRQQLAGTRPPPARGVHALDVAAGMSFLPPPQLHRSAPADRGRRYPRRSRRTSASRRPAPPLFEGRVTAERVFGHHNSSSTTAHRAPPRAVPSVPGATLRARRSSPCTAERCRRGPDLVRRVHLNFATRRKPGAGPGRLPLLGRAPNRPTVRGRAPRRGDAVNVRGVGAAGRGVRIDPTIRQRRTEPGHKVIPLRPTTNPGGGTR